MVRDSGLPERASATRAQVRRLRELLPVLYDTESCRDLDLDLPAYKIYRDCCGEDAREILRKYGLRYDVTVMPPLLLGEEYVKTLGHHHSSCGDVGSHPEVFEVLEGEARFLTQQERAGEVVDVSLTVAGKGEKVLISPDCGHVMINASHGTLVTGNMISQTCIQVYDRYLVKRGGAFYILTGGRLVRNPRYSRLPAVRVLRVETRSFLDDDSGLVHGFLKDPDRFAFLNELRRTMP